MGGGDGSMPCGTAPVQPVPPVRRPRRRSQFGTREDPRGTVPRMETLIVERSGGVVTVTMNRPEKKNALNSTMWEELISTLREVRERPSDRVLVLTGAAGAFCSGADVSNMGGSGGEPTDDERAAGHFYYGMRRVNDVALALHELPKPTIAKVGGVAAGAGCNLALGCDLIVAGQSARFSEIFAKRGLSVDAGGTWLLPRIVGLHRAKELAFFAEVISSAEAKEIGLVNRVVPDAELDTFVDDWARRLAATAPVAISQTKRMLNIAHERSLARALEDEMVAQGMNFNTKDTMEAVRAFMEKRDPTFRGF